MTDVEIERVRQLIDFMRQQESILQHDSVQPSEDSICPICYSKSVSATFEPCQHQSCANCIVQHLMSNKVCFYCKTQIHKVTNFDGVAIYECAEDELVPQRPAAVAAGVSVDALLTDDPDDE